MKNLEELLNNLPKCPPEISAATGDLVAWTSKDAHSKELGEWKINNCYAAIMPNLSKLEIHCRPYNRGAPIGSGIYTPSIKTKGPRGPLEGRLNPLQYLRFMNSCRRAGMIPEGAKYFVDPKEGNCLFIPRNGYDRHTIFELLTLYRTVDSRPDGAWLILYLQDFLRKHGIFLPFLQIFFFAAQHSVYPYRFRSAHGWPLNFCAYPSLAKAWAFSRFFRFSLKERKKLFEEPQTITMWINLAHSLKLPLPLKSKEWTAWNPSELQLLHPRYSPIFTRPEEFDKEKLLALREKEEEKK